MKMICPMWNHSLMTRYDMWQFTKDTQRSQGEIMSDPSDRPKLTVEMGKRELIRNANAQFDRLAAQNARQITSINRLLSRWNELKDWLAERVEDHTVDGHVLDEGDIYENALNKLKELED